MKWRELKAEDIYQGGTAYPDGESVFTDGPACTIGWLCRWEPENGLVTPLKGWLTAKGVFLGRGLAFWSDHSPPELVAETLNEFAREHGL